MKRVVAFVSSFSPGERYFSQGGFAVYRPLLGGNVMAFVQWRMCNRKQPYDAFHECGLLLVRKRFYEQRKGNSVGFYGLLRLVDCIKKGEQYSRAKAL